jgi:hypothetical protein
MSAVIDTVAGKPPGREEADLPHPDHWWVEMVTFPQIGPEIGPAGLREDRGGGSWGRIVGEDRGGGSG